MFGVLLGPFVRLFGAACQQGGSFFGFPTWYKYLDSEPLPSGRCGPVLHSPADASLIGLAILDMLLRVAGFLAVGFVIYGGTKMIMAQGDPEKIRIGRNTVVNSLVGLVITIAATAVVTYIGKKL